MAITNELLAEGLAEAGVPEALIQMSQQDIEDERLKARYLMASDMLQTKPVIFVVGNDSPVKDQLCVKLMRRYMFRNDKTGRWLTPARIAAFGDPVKPAGIVTVVGLDLLTPQQSKVVSQILRDWIPMGRAFILSAASVPAFDEIFGRDMANYLSHQASILELNTPRCEMMRV